MEYGSGEPEDLEYLEKYPEDGPESEYLGQMEFEYSENEKLRRIRYGYAERYWRCSVSAGGRDMMLGTQ